MTADPSVVLVGGQAVFFWARFLGLVTAGSFEDRLVSKDIDFEGSAAAARATADLLGGRSRVPSFDHHTPLTGVVFFDDSDGFERRVDFLVAPLGLNSRDVRDTAVEIEIGAGASLAKVWAMHPERVMESRIANVQILKIGDEHAIAQLRTSIAIAREWSRFLLGADSVPERDRVRAVLRLNERIFRKCDGDLHFRQLFAERGIDPFDAVLVDDSRLPDAFRSRRYPQMVEQLHQRRGVA
ncbi:MAG: hypothetical protein ACYDHH_21470 [Solirubrobacteraceae bacterium]